MTKKIYFENLDGLRFLCFLSVFFFHSFHTEFDYIKSTGTYHFIKHDIFGNGNLGVNFFFVLSGFLITYLLIEEKKLNGQIDIKKFWIRRILRIWPLFYLCVIIGFFIFPILKSAFGQQPNETASIWYYLTFTNNFDFIKKGLPDASILGVLWSVAIEEQFYFVWPIILYFLPVQKYWIAFTTVIIGSLIFRAANNNYLMHEYHTLSCIGDMAVGALGAWLIQTNSAFKNRIQNLAPVYISLIYISFLTIFLFRDEILSGNLPLLSVMERPIIAFIILLIILEQCFSEKSLFKMSRFRLFTKLGTISYGLYCLHFVGILIVTTLTKKYSLNTEMWQVFILDTSFALILTIVISLISYNVYEKPFLKLKDKFAYIKAK
ncbi:MAG: acyltransferase [Bacteroidetes bacterium]|nr:acyltransferase [Bacteroidota bacterium]